MREKIRLSNLEEYEIENIFSMNNLLKIIFSDDVDINALTSDMNAFERINILTRNKEVCGTYDNFVTIYLSEGQTLFLSNDGSVYEEPENVLPDIPVIETTPAIAREMKISDFSNSCNNAITNGVTVDIDGIPEHFSYTLEDQNNLDTALDMAQLTGLSVPYHADNASCKLFTPDQIKKIYVASKTNLTHHQTYFNQMKCYINSLQTVDEIEAVVYGSPLTGEYLENYNLIMEQAKAIINSLFKEARW